MAAPSYELWLTTDKGVRISPLDHALWWQASRQVNRIGNFKMGLPTAFDQSLLKPDRMFQLWRQPIGGALRLWRVYFLRGWRFERSEAKERITIWGPDSLDLLRRRIVAYFAGGADANYTSTAADDLMKDVVTAAITNGTTPAPAAGTRVWADLSVAANLTDGPLLDKGCAWQPLLTDSGSGVLPELAEASRVAGTEVFFDVVASNVSATSISFQFRTYTGQPGVDVSDRVVFTEEDLNLKDPYYEEDYSDEQNYIYAGGKGEQADRSIQQVYDAGRYGVSKWARCEGFANATNQATDNGVREAGRALLETSRPKISAGGVPVDTIQTRLGLDWDIGYKVTMRYRNIQFASIVRSIVLAVNDKGQESVTARLEYES